jgi:hypothetical protein
VRNLVSALQYGGGLLVTILMGGCAGHGTSNGSANAPIVYAQVGQTVKEVVDSLPPMGGVVALGVGTWPSGYNNAVLSAPNITIQGSGMPSYNADFTAMSGGTIVLGRLSATTGADYLTVRDLGVDAGPAYINSNNGGVALDAFGIYNIGQVLGAPQVQSPVIENVSCLGYSPTAAVHCMLVENVNKAYVHNVQTVMNGHGLVLKGTNSRVDGVFARGHGVDSVIVKSDGYAPASQDFLSNITIEPLISAGDTKGIIIIGVGAPVSDIIISKAQIRSPLAWGIYAQGASETTSATGIRLSDISVDYQGGSPAAEYCMQFVQYVSGVHIENLSCSNMWIGIAPYLPASSMFNDFTVTNSQFTNIGTDAIDTYGGWKVLNTEFVSVSGNGIVNPFGVTTLEANTFVNIGGSDMLSSGGSFVELTVSPVSNRSHPFQTGRSAPSPPVPQASIGNPAALSCDYKFYCRDISSLMMPGGTYGNREH